MFGTRLRGVACPTRLRRLAAAAALALVTVSCGQADPTEARQSPGSGRRAAQARSANTGFDPPRLEVRPPGSADTEATRQGRPRFRGEMRRIHGPMSAELIGRNWHPGCPVPLQDLRLLTIDHWGFDGEVHSGLMVVNEIVAEDVLWVFEQLFRAHFPIKEIALARKYRPRGYPDNKRSVTASFNCRPVTDSPGTLSQHSYGWAIDVNPLQNPYVRSDGSVLRPSAKPYRDRTLDAPGMIQPGDIVVRSFAAIGWEWGGNWSPIVDYMHFSLYGG